MVWSIICYIVVMGFDSSIDIYGAWPRVRSMTEIRIRSQICQYMTWYRKHRQVTDIWWIVVFKDIAWLGRATNFAQTLMISPGEYTFIPVGKNIETETSKLWLEMEEDNVGYSEEPGTYWKSWISAWPMYHLDSDWTPCCLISDSRAATP